MRTPRLAMLLLLLLAAPLAAQKPAITDAQFAAVIELPYYQADAALHDFDLRSVSDQITKRYGADWEQRLFLHLEALWALECVHGREGTMREAYDVMLRPSVAASVFAAARAKCGDPAANASLQGCLVNLLGIGNGSRIFDRICDGGEVAMVKGRYAGVSYDCSAFLVPLNCKSPSIPPPPPPPPPPPVSTCTPRPLPQEAIDIVREAQTWRWMRAGRLTKLARAESLLVAYRPCLESTGRLEMHLRDIDGRVLLAP